MKFVTARKPEKTSGPIWMMFECFAGSRWMSTTEDATNDICEYSGCNCGSIVRKVGETDDRYTDWFGLRVGARQPVPTMVSDLRVNHLTPDRHKTTCGYWYTVTCGTLAHVAFATREHLDLWLSERGLAIAGDISESGSSSVIVGQYRETCHMNPAGLDGLTGIDTRRLSNAEYTRAVIVTDSGGIRNVHYLNVNIRSRITYDYTESRAMFG